MLLFCSSAVFSVYVSKHRLKILSLNFESLKIRTWLCSGTPLESAAFTERYILCIRFKCLSTFCLWENYARSPARLYIAPPPPKPHPHLSPFLAEICFCRLLNRLACWVVSVEKFSCTSSPSAYHAIRFCVLLLLWCFCKFIFKLFHTPLTRSFSHSTEIWKMY